MSIRLLAFILLLARLGSMTFIVLVLLKQWRLLQTPIEPYIQRFRKVLFALSVAILLGNLVPIFIDTLTLFVETQRPASVKGISIAYAFSNAITSFISSYLIWTLYRLASETADVEKLETRHVKDTKKQ